MPDLRMIPGVELLRTGRFQASTGPVMFTRDDLHAIVRASRDPEIRRGVVKLGHQDTDTSLASDGQPAKGYVDNLRVISDGETATLVGDLIGVPGDLADRMPHEYPHRSVEVRWGVTTPSGVKHPAVLEGLALLGATRPAIEGLAPIEGVYRTAASGPYDDEGTRSVVHLSDDPSETSQKGAGMELAKIREALGLADDVPEDDVLVAAQEYRAAAQREAQRKADEEAAAAAAAATTPPVEPRDLVAASAGDGAQALLAAQAQQDVARLSAEVAELRANETRRERDAFLDHCQNVEGRFAPAQRASLAALYDADPNTAREYITTHLAAGTVPVRPIGHSGDETNGAAEHVDQVVEFWVAQSGGKTGGTV